MAAFSLVEVVIAIGIVSFAFVGILGLLPAGMHQFRGAINTTVCTQIAQQIISDAQQTDFDTLIDKENLPGGDNGSRSFAFRAPKVNQPEFRYFNERGREIVPSAMAARTSPQALTDEERAIIVYQVNVRIQPQTQIPRSAANDIGGRQLATITVQVANNPGNRNIKLSSGARDDGNDATRQLFISTPGVSVLTFASQIARNQ